MEELTPRELNESIQKWKKWVGDGKKKIKSMRELVEYIKKGDRHIRDPKAYEGMMEDLEKEIRDIEEGIARLKKVMNLDN